MLGKIDAIRAEAEAEGEDLYALVLVMAQSNLEEVVAVVEFETAWILIVEGGMNVS